MQRDDPDEDKVKAMEWSAPVGKRVHVKVVEVRCAHPSLSHSWFRCGREMPNSREREIMELRLAAADTVDTQCRSD
jgi:hypothetical protein